MRDSTHSTDQMIDDILSAFAKGKPYLGGDVPLEAFRDLYNRWKGSGKSSPTWILVLMEKEVVVEAWGQCAYGLVIKDQPARFYMTGDFDFMDEKHRLFLGTINGRYSFWRFCRDVVSIQRIIAGMILWMLFLFGAYHAQTTLLLSISQSLIAALSIFVTIFTVLTLSLDPEREYRYLEKGYFHVFVQSDKYIAAIGVVALGIAIIGAALASTSLSAQASTSAAILLRLARSTFLSVASLAALLSFWLVLRYHFGRKYKMTEMRMGKRLLEQLQREGPDPCDNSITRN